MNPSPGPSNFVREIIIEDSKTDEVEEGYNIT